MNVVKKIFGLAPTKEPTGRGYIPSPLGRLLGVDKKSGFSYTDFGGKKYTGDKKIIVLCTEERYLKMANNTYFSTGNNVVETMVPLMHLVSGGFDFTVVTPTGKPAILEAWSVPKNDESVRDFMEQHKAKFEKPRSLQNLVDEIRRDEAPEYLALFIPGGHGSMIGLPDDENVGKLIQWIKDTDRHLITVCHGPAAITAPVENSTDLHPYTGYSIVAFPDAVDRQSPVIGYLPSQLPWFQGEALAKHGITVLNKRITGATHTDRKLISGDSPKACDDLGKIAVHALFEEMGL